MIVLHRRTFACLTALGLGLAGCTAAFAELSAKQKQAIIEVDPMVFFVAKGEPDDCGPGCSEWIAAEGSIDRNAHVRLQELLNSLDQRDRPIYFNSGGGILGAAVGIGRILRDRSMTAGVARTVPDICRTGINEQCRRTIRSQRELKARLSVVGSLCNSACIYALIGASTRRVPAEARLGIHAPRSLLEEAMPLEQSARSRHALRQATKRYVAEMGVDPGLVDAAARVGHNLLRALNRAEVANFGIVTRSRYETDWLADKDPWGRPLFMKSVTEPVGPEGRDFRTSVIRASCLFNGQILFAYHRRMHRSEDGALVAVRLGAGDGSIVLRETVAADVILASQTFATIDAFRKAIAASNMTITETFSPSEAPGWSRAVKLSMEGLAETLDGWQKRCMEL